MEADYEGRAGRTLLGRLSTSASLSSQGERLCTIGLAYLLEEPPLRDRFASWLSEISEAAVRPDLEWRAESVQSDLARPDVEGLADLVPIVRIEAKIGAPFGPGQLAGYADGLVESPGDDDRLLVVLVPSRELPYVQRMVEEQIPAAQRSPCLSVVVTSWDQLFDALLPSGERHGDVEQLEGLYRGLAGQYVEPLSEEDFKEWREREEAFTTLADLASKRLSPSSPSTKEGQYSMRYVCESTPQGAACFSIGVHPPFDERASTPIWLRYHCETKTFSQLRARLGSSRYAAQINNTDGHVWLPLTPPTDSPPDQMIEALIHQALDINNVAHGRST